MLVNSLRPWRLWAIRNIWHLNRNLYYLDNYIFGSFLAIMLTSIVWRAFTVPSSIFVAGLMFAFGLFVWTLIEYATHRWIFHGLLAEHHILHHRKPEAYIGAPNYLTVSIFVILMGALVLALPIGLVTGFSSGIVFGYLCYLIMHDHFHHSPISLDLFHRLRRYHRAHHETRACNFGVITHFWDRVFQTTS